MSALVLDKVGFSYDVERGEERGEAQVLCGIDARLEKGALTALVGLNGAGKSTFLKLAAGLLVPTDGAVRFSGAQDFSDSVVRARHIAYLPQSQPIAWRLRCRDVVALGRVPYASDKVGDDEAIDAALAQCGLQEFAARQISSLSGGEQARVLLARVLAGAAETYLLDEPVRALDLHRQTEVMALLRDKAESGKAVLVALHELSLAARFCHKVLVLADGKCAAYGTPQAVFTPALLASIFNIEPNRVWH